MLAAKSALHAGSLAALQPCMLAALHAGSLACWQPCSLAALQPCSLAALQPCSLAYWQPRQQEVDPPLKEAWPSLCPF